MGLDVTGYAKCTLVEAVSLHGDRDAWDAAQEKYDGEDSMTMIYVDGFPERMADISEGVYRYETGYDFRAGSYSGYSYWREQLAAAVGTTPEDVWADAKAGNPPTSLPFYELINLSDCESAIGPSVCAKLRDDFERERPRVMAWAESNLGGPGRHRFADVYEHFAKAFALGADGGFVKFH